MPQPRVPARPDATHDAVANQQQRAEFNDKASAKQTSANAISAGGMLGFISEEFGKISLIVEAIRRQLESLIRVRERRSAFRQH
jgi:hypothetical protein